MSKRKREEVSRKCIKLCSGPPNYSCDSCGFKTKSLTGLRLHHKAIHKEYRMEKPVDRCSVCKEAFKDEREVKKHIKKAHKNHKWEWR